LILPLFIIDIGGSATTIGLSAFLSLMPIIIVYPFAGVMGDRLNRKHKHKAQKSIKKAINRQIVCL